MSKKNYEVIWPVQLNFDVAITRNGTKYGLVDANNQEIIEPTFDVIFDFILEYEIAIVGNFDKYGAINEKGEVVIELTYNSVSALIQDLKKLLK